MASSDNCNASGEEDQGEHARIPGIGVPSREALAALEAAPPLTAEQVAVENARLIWNYNVCSVLSEHPRIGVAGSAANRRFVELFHTLGSRLEDLRTVADFVMIYPPKASALEVGE